MANSIEEQVEGYYKNLLKSLGVRHYAKTEEINSKITEALKNSVSKGGGSGMNYPDIKLLIDFQNKHLTQPKHQDSHGSTLSDCLAGRYRDLRRHL